MQKEELEIFNSSKVFNDTVKIDDEISYIYEALVNPLKMPVAIFDLGGKIIIKGRDYPEFCKDNCLIDKNDGICPMYSDKGEYAPPQYKALSAVICPHGLTVFTTFITLNNKPIGMIKRGHIQTISSNSKNNIASLAVKEDAMKTYQSIIDISKTLRYKAANQNHFVQLKSEIEFLKNYTNLQKLKYGERLKISIDASTDINNKNVPFNCLQLINVRITLPEYIT
ncbi:histidine kinase [Clostridium thailandense]|uniref:histidine kinase n=1 Tax=Clostridium thailandense TaxID=2794346 RepID=UPI00398A2A0A